MATSQKPADGGTPPYLPFARFESFVVSLKGKPLPARFDRTLVRNMSGAEQSQLGIALRFFKLIEGDDKRFTDRMKRLVEAHGRADAWRDAMTELLGEYDDIVGELDGTATMGQLTEAYRDKGGLAGSAGVKAIRFYLTVARAADAKLSPHYASPTTVPGNGASTTSDRAPRRARTRRSRDSGDASSSPDAVPDGVKKLRYTVPSGDIQVTLPEGVTTKELDALSKYLKEYVELMGSE